MLVTFKTDSYADITMFGEAAESLLKLMGQSGNVPGALMAADVSDALDTLKENLKSTPDESAQSPADDDEDGANRVALATRALPLIELLESAIEANENVVWDN